MNNQKPSSYLIFETQVAWRNWLESNYKTHEGVWIQIKKANASIQGIRLQEAVEVALSFGWIDGQMYSIDVQRFIIYVSKRRKHSVWSLINKRRILALIKDGLVVEEGLLTIEDAMKHGTWDDAYTSKETLHHSQIWKQTLTNHPKAQLKYTSLSHITQLHVELWVEQCRSESTLNKRMNTLLHLLEQDNLEDITNAINALL